MILQKYQSDIQEASIKTSRGMSLVEVMISTMILAILTVGITAAFFSTRSLRQLTSDRVRVSAALQDKAEEILALRKQAAPNQNGLDYLISQCNSVQSLQTFTLPGGVDGNGAVTIYLNESQVPTELGASPVTFTNADGETFGRLDLDGDGLDTGNHSVPSGGVYGAALLPVEVNATFNFDNAPVKVRRFLLIARTDD
jgi:prepilin-type N-terminal cleavage/methylation domain-containing protein